MPVGAAALIVALRILPKDRTAPASAAQFDLPGALTAIGGLTALMFGLAGTAVHGWLSARTLTALSLSAVLLAAFAIIERRVRRPLVAPHTWKVVTLIAGTTVMLGVTAILVGTVFLTSIFFQTVMGFSPLLAGIAFLPLALAITAGTPTAGNLTSPAGVVAGFSRGFVAAAVVAVLVAITALLKMPSTRTTGSAHMHMH